MSTSAHSQSYPEPQLAQQRNPALIALVAVPIISIIAFFLLPLTSSPVLESSLSDFKSGSIKDRFFDPSSYDQKVAKCKAKDRSHSGAGKDFELDIHYLDINPTNPNTLLFVHGWPATFSSWRSQILEFQDTHRLIVPTLRGFGNSTAPEDPEFSTTTQDMTGDLECVLQDAGVASTVPCIGHDWGSIICWAAVAEPATRSRYHAVANAASPYFPPPPSFIHPRETAKQIPTLGYQTYFSDNRHLAVRELESDVRAAIKAVLLDRHAVLPGEAFKSHKYLIAAWDGNVPDQRLISKAEEDYWVNAFETSGFEKSLALYAIGNKQATWRKALERDTQVISIPALFFAPSKDILGPMDAIMKPMEAHVPNLTIVHVEASHWVQLERPEEYNAALASFLDGLQ